MYLQIISQYLITYQAQDLNNSVRDKIVKHYFYDGKKHQVSEMQNRLTNDFEIVKNNFFEWYVIVPFYGSMLVASLITLISIPTGLFCLKCSN